MYQTNQFPSYDASFYYLCSSALGIVDQDQQFGATEQQPIYQGIPVQVLNPIPTYNSGPDTYQNEADHSYSLNKYNITSLTNLDSKNASGTGIQEIPQSILDEYVPYQPEYKPINNALLLTPNTPFQQLISWDELEREQTTANHTNSGLQLTNLPAGIHSSQDLRPVAVVNPLYMHQATTVSQTTQAEVNVDGSSSLVERKRERQRERQRERKRQRYHTDPAYAEREKERQRELRKDPVYTEGQNIYKMIYRRIKRQTSNKEEAKELAVIARARYLQSVNSDKNSGDLPLTSNLAETFQSSGKNLDSTAPPLFSRQTEGVFTVPIEPISP
ncbi:hypothetical protein [Endozoicomonas acroporae]|uniref:hypothetical protein n=1 Tax=Endozoicomonas acroporae TaxID=1701104 RepID=UPI0013CFC5BD|nr:hypothetical protein [Endozoicomonas acroporae]